MVFMQRFFIFIRSRGLIRESDLLFGLSSLECKIIDLSIIHLKNFTLNFVTFSDWYIQCEKKISVLKFLIAS